MSERQTSESSAEQTKTNAEKFAAFTGLTATLYLDAHNWFKSAMEGSDLESVEVEVASVELEDGQAVAFGVRRSELLRHIQERGNPNSPEAGMIGIQPERQLSFSADGTEIWPPVSRLLEVPEPEKSYDPIGAPWL